MTYELKPTDHLSAVLTRRSAALTTYAAASADCSAVIVGRDASATGRVLFGHNEDDSGNNVIVRYAVPRATHAAGERLTFEPECAAIPQVAETWAYQWSELRTDWRPSFSDTFINEWGLAIASNNCSPSREDRPALTEGGIGYGLGHVIAQRARTAREAVELAAALISHYGYTGSGRAYELVDQNEGWLLQVVQGKHFVAQRVPDDAVMYVPNRYTSRTVTFSDGDSYVASPDLVTYACERGWYVPAVPGNDGDFDFAQAYQAPFTGPDVNTARQRNALRLLLGSEPRDLTQFAVRPTKKVTLASLRRLLRSHFEGTDDDFSGGYVVNPHQTGVRTICHSETVESFIVEFHDQPALTCVWRATGNPCTSPFVPWYLGATRVPTGYGWLTPAAGLASHFAVAASDLAYRPSRAWWAFQNVQDLADASYATAIGEITHRRELLERQWNRGRAEFEARVATAARNDPPRVAELLTDYTNTQAGLAWRIWRALFQELLSHV